MKYISIHIVNAAGGNATAIAVLSNPLTRENYALHGKQLGKDFESLGAEQAGFLIPSQNHFEMAGGEFCGNATRSAAYLLSKLKLTNTLTFTVSGFGEVVHATVEHFTNKTAKVSCKFPGLSASPKKVELKNGTLVSVVDLGGIVHITTTEPFPLSKEVYEARHQAIVKELGLDGREAVGVLWLEDKGLNSILIHPVVWVRDVDTFFYETSCGSGTIAAASVTGSTNILQPSGKEITAVIEKNGITLTSFMEEVTK